MMTNILVTGASRGIGRAIVLEFSKDKNNRIFFTYNKSENAAESLSKETGAIGIKADIRENPKNVLNEVHKYGKLDILINNAAIAQQKMFQDITDFDFDNMMNTNIRGMFMITREAVGDMISKKSGKIINISSMWGISGASCEVHYSCSKSAVVGFTKALAKELGPSGINVNCIAPGVIDTDMNKCFDEETMNELCEQTPMGRIGKPQDVANLAAFLASDKSDFITGQIITIDGGFIL